MGKHTPGAWKLIELDGITFINPDRGGDEYALIARITGPNLASGRHDANARLIAAAPELLAALENILAAFAVSAMQGEGCDPIQNAVSAVRKAAGEE